MKAVGIILAGGSSIGLKELTTKRASAAMPVGAAYRAVDFGLSNMTNSGIKTVAVLTQYNSRSLHEHLNSSKWWNFGRKQGGLFTFTPTITKNNNWWYRGTADSLYQNMDFLRKRHEQYVIIYPGDCVCKFDFSKMLKFHEEKNADITIAVKHMEAGDDLRRLGIVEMDQDKRVRQFFEKPMKASSTIASMGIYLMKKELLMKLLQESHDEERYDLVQDILIRYKDVVRIFGYEFDGYWNNINTIDSYYQCNMDFLDKEIRHYFEADPAIRSKTEDLPSAKFNEGSSVKNALISSGCIINGEVENSVLCKKVFVGKGAVIKNSIVLNETYIEDGAVIENCIVESHERIPGDAEFIGEIDEPKIVRLKN